MHGPSGSNCGYDLEVNSQTEFHLTRVEDRSGDFAKIRRLVKSQVVGAAVAWVTWLEVVKDISELHCELQPHSFRELDVLCERRIHVPARQTSQVARAAATGIEAKNTSPESAEDCRRIGEHVEAFGIVGAYTIRTRDAAIGCGLDVVRHNWNGGLESACATAGVSRLSERLAVGPTASRPAIVYSGRQATPHANER